MPASAPDSVTDPSERELYRDISRVFENYCGVDPSVYKDREDSFLRICDLAKSTILSKRQPKGAEIN